MIAPAHTAADRALEAIRDGRWNVALRNADIALAEGSTEPWLARLRGVALTNLGRVDEGASVLEAVVDADPSPVVFHELAAARLARDDLLGARRAVNRAQALDAGSAHTRRAAALLSMRNSEWAAAETELRATVIDDQFDIEALNNLAICLLRQGRGGEATEFMRMARSRGQSSRHWQLLDHNFDLLMSTRRPGDDDDAPAAPTPAAAADSPRPSMGAAILRARYEGLKNRDPGSMPRITGRGSQRVLMGLLVIMVLVTLVGAAARSPELAPFALVGIATTIFFVVRSRRGRLLTVLPTSARLRVEPRTGR